MGKVVSKILTVVAVVASIAAAIPTFGASLGISAALLTGIAVASSLGASLLAPRPKAPATSGATVSRLTTSIDLLTGRKIWLGHTAGNNDLRDEEYTDSQAYLHRWVLNASHKATAYEAIYFDDQLAWTSANGVQGQYVGYLTVTPVLEGSAANAINVSARMGASRRYTGCSYVYFRFKLTGNSKNTDSPFVSSVPSRVTIVGKGAPTYDPRKDSTVGGSGSHRADDQTTWEWDDNASRNPVIQELWYELGWRIRNPVTGEWKLAVGKGIPPARLNLASYIDAANLCDEAVAMAAGGTEPRYRSDGVFSENDDPSLVRDSLKAACNATLDDVDGKIRMTVLHNDTASPIGDLTTSDVIGDFTWEQTPALNDSVNVIRGGFTDPSTASLYQLADYPEVRFTSPDGIDRPQTVNLPLVQSPSQAQRLIKMRLQRAVFGGTFEAVFQATAWRFQKGDVIRFTFRPLGWVNKLFRIADMTVQLDGTVPMILREEDPAIYAWDATDAPAVVGVAATTYDPRLGAMITAIDEASAGAITGLLTNESHTLPAAADGTVSTYAGATGQFLVFLGLDDVSSSFSLSTPSGGNPQALTVGYSSQTYTVSGGLDAAESNATLTIRATGSGVFAGVTIDKVFSLSKSLVGATGAAPPLISLAAAPQQILFDKTGALVAGQSSTLTATRQNTASATTWKLLKSDGTVLYSAVSAATLASAFANGSSSPNNDTVIITGAAFDAAFTGNSCNGFIFEVSVPGVADRVSVAKLQDGATGGSAFSLVNINKAVCGVNSITAPTAAPWDGKARTGEAYRTATITGYLSVDTMIGLTSNPTLNSSFTNTAYGLHRSSNGNIYLLQGGGVSRPFADPDAATGNVPSGPFSITTDGKTVRFFYKGSELTAYATAVGGVSYSAIGESVYGVFNFATGAALITNIGFSAAGEAGNPGVSALKGVATPDSVTVACTANGTPKAAIPNVAYSATQGMTDVTASLTYGTITSSGMSGVSVSGGLISVTGMSADTGSIRIPISYGGATDIITVVYQKTKDGAAYVTDSNTISTPTNSYTVTSSISLLVGPSGTLSIDLNGSFAKATAGTINTDGYVEVSYNGGGTFTTVTGSTFTGNAATTGSPGDFAASGSIAGPGSKVTAIIRLQQKMSTAAALGSFGGTLAATWVG